MSDFDAMQNFDTCHFGVAGAHYCTRMTDTLAKIEELENRLAEKDAEIERLRAALERRSIEVF